MEKIKVALWGGAHIVYLPFHAALHNGYFQDLDLEVQCYPAGNDDDVFEEVLKGKADFGIADPTFAVHGRTRGQEVKVIASLVSNAATWGVTSHPEINQIKQIYDFASLRFASFKRPSTAFSLISNIKNQNAKQLKSMTIIEEDIGKLRQLLSNDSADVVIENEPMISLAEQDGFRTVIALSDFYPSFLYTGIISKAKNLKESGKQTQSFISGIQKGLTFCQSPADKLLPIVKELFPSISDSTLLNSIKRMQASRAWPEQALIQSQSWQNSLKLRYELGEIEKIEDPTSFLDQTFAYHAITS